MKQNKTWAQIVANGKPAVKQNKPQIKNLQTKKEESKIVKQENINKINQTIQRVKPVGRPIVDIHIKDGFPPNYRDKESQQGTFNFEAMPKDLKLMIFEYIVKRYNIAFYDCKQFEGISKRWYYIFGNINYQVKFWPFKDASVNFDTYYLTSQMLKTAKNVPNTYTVSQFVYIYERRVDDGYFDETPKWKTINNYDTLFAESYDPRIWKNMRLPTLEEITDRLESKIHEYVQDAIARSEQAAKYVLDMLMYHKTELYKNLKLRPFVYDCFISGLRDGRSKYCNLSPKFVDWCIKQDWCPKHPSCLASLATSMPLNYLKNYVEIYCEHEWNHHKSKQFNKKLTKEKCRQKILLQMYKELESCFIIGRRQIIDDKELIEKFSYFFNQVPIEETESCFLYALNGFTCLESCDKADGHVCDIKQSKKVIEWLAKIIADAASSERLKTIMTFNWYTPSYSKARNFKVTSRKLEEEKYQQKMLQYGKTRKHINDKKMQKVINQRKRNRQFSAYDIDIYSDSDDSDGGYDYNNDRYDDEYVERLTFAELDDISTDEDW